MGAPLASGTVLHGRYTITMRLQGGSGGALYQGTDALAAAKVVVIYEATDPSPEARARFEQEAQMLAHLEHPSLPVVLDSFEEPSRRQYLVLLGFQEPNLGTVLAGGRSFSEGDVLAWFTYLVSAVEHLHAQQPPIIHGRISPANIVITADGTPHLTGLVGVQGAEAPGEVTSGGPFLAPEQRDGLADERTDVYALGATLYALLTARAPADAAARADGKDLTPPRQIARGVSRQVEVAILKAMALDPAQRPPGVVEFWQALTQPGQPDAAGARRNWQRPTVPEMRRPRLPRLLLAAGAVVALAALALLGGYLLHLSGTESAPPSPTVVHAVATSTVAQAASAPTATAVPPTAVSPTAVPPTSTPQPTATVVVPTPRPTARATPVPAATRWFAGPTASATPRWFPAPTLVSPGGGVLKGPVEFRWSWPYTLADDEYFDLQVYRMGLEPKGIAWCKEPYYAADGLLAGEGQYQWRVQIIRGTDGKVEGVVSDPSPARSFTWQAAPE